MDPKGTAPLTEEQSTDNPEVTTAPEDNGMNNPDDERDEEKSETYTADQYQAAKKEAEENYQRYLRAQADLDNFRRRARQEKEEFAKYASAKLLEQLLPVVDNFERALEAAKNNDGASSSFMKGVEMIFRQLEQVLQQEGLQAMETVGQPFNPEFQQAIMQVDSEEYEEGIVVEEVQKGYMLKDKVLRPAMVKVSS